MKRSEFLACLVNSFGGKQKFADALHERLTSESFSESDGTTHLWHMVLGLLEPDGEQLRLPRVLAMMGEVDPEKPEAKESATENAG